MAIEIVQKDVAYFINRSYKKGLTTSTGGNISCRYEDKMCITPSGMDKGRVKSEDIAIVDLLTGNNLTPYKKLSIETEMHRLIYLTRSDVFSVVHLHPTFSCLFSASDEEINTSLIAESWYLLDRVVKAPYKLMGTKELAEEVTEYAKTSNCILLENHGALTVGRSLLQSFDRMECLEQAAKLTYLAKSVRVSKIPSEKLNEIEKLR